MKAQVASVPLPACYTVEGEEKAEARIQRDVRRLADLLRERFPGARALFLVGGYGRGEGAIHLRAGVPEPFNDYDLLLVFDRLGGLQRRRVQREIRDLLLPLREAVGIPVDVGVQDRRGLARAPLCILWYEMAAGHRLLWGDSDVEFPEFAPSSIPLDEAILLLTNRGSSVLLRYHDRGTPGPAPVVTVQDAIDAMKLVLAWGDVILLTAKCYTASYVERQRRLATLREDLGPFGAELPRLYERAVEFKLRPRPADVSADEVARLVGLHEEFLRWFESLRLGRRIDSWRGYAQSEHRKLTGRFAAGRMLLKHLVRLGPPRDKDNLRLHFRPTYERLISTLPLLLFGTPEDWQEAARLLNLPARFERTWRSSTLAYLKLWK